MLQNLLIDRLKLQFHRESMVKPVYALTVGKQLKLKESSGSGATDCATVGGAQDQNHKDCKQKTMEALADTLPQLAPLYFDRPIVDGAGLKGTYDFKLDGSGRRLQTTQPNAAPDPGGAAFGDPESGPTLFDALGRLGLKLGGKKAADFDYRDRPSRSNSERKLSVCARLKLPAAGEPIS